MKMPDVVEEEAKLVQERAKKRFADLRQSTDKLVHDHPWKALGAAAVVGVVLGLLLGRRS